MPNRRSITETWAQRSRLAVAGGCGRDLEMAQGPPEIAGESCDDVDLTVGVDADGDAGRPPCGMLPEAILMSSRPPSSGG